MFSFPAALVLRTATKVCVHHAVHVASLGHSCQVALCSPQSEMNRTRSGLTAPHWASVPSLKLLLLSAEDFSALALLRAVLFSPPPLLAYHSCREFRGYGSQYAWVARVAKACNYLSTKHFAASRPVPKQLYLLAVQTRQESSILNTLDSNPLCPVQGEFQPMVFLSLKLAMRWCPSLWPLPYDIGFLQESLSPSWL